MTKIVWNTLTAEMIEPGILSVGNSSDTLGLRVHKLLVAIAADWAKTTDQQSAVKRVNALMDALGNGVVRRQALVAWVTSPKHFGMILADKTEPGKTAGTTKTVKRIVAGKMKASKLDMQFLTNSHWWSFTKEPEFRAFNFSAKITALIVEADKMVKRADKRDTIPTAALTALREIDKSLAA